MYMTHDEPNWWVNGQSLANLCTELAVTFSVSPYLDRFVLSIFGKFFLFAFLHSAITIHFCAISCEGIFVPYSECRWSFERSYAKAYNFSRIDGFWHRRAAHVFVCVCLPFVVDISVWQKPLKSYLMSNWVWKTSSIREWNFGFYVKASSNRLIFIYVNMTYTICSLWLLRFHHDFIRTNTRFQTIHFDYLPSATLNIGNWIQPQFFGSLQARPKSQIKSCTHTKHVKFSKWLHQLATKSLAPGVACVICYQFPNELKNNKKNTRNPHKQQIRRLIQSGTNWLIYRLQCPSSNQIDKTVEHGVRLASAHLYHASELL